MASSTTENARLRKTSGGEWVEYDEFIDLQIRKTARAGQRRRDRHGSDDAGRRCAGVLSGGGRHRPLDSAARPRLRAGCLRRRLFLGGAGYYAADRLLPWLIYRINPIYAAQAIEKSRPTLKNSLINFLFLRGQSSRLPSAVYQAIEEQAATGLSRVQVEAAVDRSRLVHIGYALLAIVGLFAAYFLFSPKNPWDTIGRVMLPWADIQVPTRVEIQDIQPGNRSVYRGETVEVSAEIKGLKEDEAVRVVYSTADHESVNQPVAMYLPHDRFRHVAKIPAPSDAAGQDSGVQQNIEYHIEAGDAISPTYHLTAVTAPTIALESVDYQYPDYTGRQRITLKGIGDIQSLEGTRVVIHGRANEKIKSAELELDGREGRSKLPMQIGSDGRSVTGSFTLALESDRVTPQFSHYRMRAEARAEPEPVQYRIEVIPDLPPEVKFILPEKDDIALPVNRRLTLRLRALDPDFALSELTLFGEANRNPVFEQHLLSEIRRVPMQVDHWIDPQQLHLKPGDVLEYWAVAKDNRAPTANETQTSRRRIRVIAADARADNSAQGQGDSSNQGNPNGQGDSANASDKAAASKNHHGEQPNQSNPAGQQKPDDQTQQGQPNQDQTQKPGNDQNSADKPQQNPADQDHAQDKQSPDQQKPGQNGQKGSAKQGERSQQDQSQQNQNGGASDQQNSENKQDSANQKSSEKQQQQGGGGSKNGGNQSQSKSGSDKGGSNSNAGGNNSNDGNSGGSNSNSAANNQSGNNSNSAGSNGNQSNAAQQNQSGGQQNANQQSQSSNAAHDKSDAQMLKDLLKQRSKKSRATINPIAAEKTVRSSRSRKIRRTNRRTPRTRILAAAKSTRAMKRNRVARSCPIRKIYPIRNRSPAIAPARKIPSQSRSRIRRQIRSKSPAATAPNPPTPKITAQVKKSASSGQPNGQKPGSDSQQGNKTGSGQAQGTKSNAGKADANKPNGDQESRQQGDANNSLNKNRSAQKPGDKSPDKSNGANSPNEQAPGDQSAAGANSKSGEKKPGDKSDQESPKDHRDSGEGQNRSANANQQDKGSGERAADGSQPTADQHKAQGDNQTAGAKGGDADSRKGESGAGTDTAKNNQPTPPSPSDANKPRDNKNQQPDGPGKKEMKSKDSGTGATASPHESNSKSNPQQDGTFSGGGGKGGGQGANQSGTGGAGQNTGADQGNGVSPEHGQGDKSQQAGSDKKSDEKTGQSGHEKGNGSHTSPSSDHPNSPNPTQSQEAGQPNSQSAKGQNGNNSANPNNQQGGSWNQSTGGGGAFDPKTPPPPQTGGTGDPANSKFAKKQFDMALETLKKGKPDLLKELNWTPEEAQKLADRLEQMRRNAELPGDKGDVARRQMGDILHSLGERSGQLDRRSGGNATDTQRGLHESHDAGPPPEYSEQVEAFQQGVLQGGK